MIETAINRSETTEMLSSAGVLDEALGALRIRGALLLCERYSSPWAVKIPQREFLRKALRLGRTTRAVAFHLIEHGHCELRFENGTSTYLKAGEVGICFGGVAHSIAAGNSRHEQPVEALLLGTRNPFAPEITGRPLEAEVVCGVFMFDFPYLNPLLESLPDIVKVNMFRSGEMHNLAGVARLLSDEVRRDGEGSRFIVERLVEVLCAEAVRSHIGHSAAANNGWIAARNDPLIGRALACLHARPEYDWSVRKIADQVAISPSRLAARFSQTIGISPMAYLTRWRMNIAARALLDSRLSIERVAQAAGYDSAAAFNRTFKKALGETPASWRRSAAASNQFKSAST